MLSVLNMVYPMLRTAIAKSAVTSGGSLLFSSICVLALLTFSCDSNVAYSSANSWYFAAK